MKNIVSRVSDNTQATPQRVGESGIQAHASARKYGVRMLTVTQTAPDMARHEAYRRKTAAFEEWRQKLNRGDRLPRGRFFKGKTPGRPFIMLDEFWQATASSVAH